MKNKKTVLLGMSGGVDSSVSAILLQKRGYDVIGAFFKLYSDTKNKLTGECSYLSDLKDARKVAAKLNIKLIVLDYENEYKSKVLNPMFKSYKSGLTPNPDLECNTIIKFPYLWKEAKKLKCDFIATGHYARIKKINSSYQLLQGKDKHKDQSYFLSGLSQEDLSHALFPMGNLIKEKTRKIAKFHKLTNWDKHGTVGICFVGQIPMQQFLNQKIKEKRGNILLENKQIIGIHKGTQFYTIGQKVHENNVIELNKPKQLASKRLYIAQKIKNNLIVVPENSDLLKKSEVKIKSLHLINPKGKIPNLLKARIRHLGELNQGKLVKKANHYSFIFKSAVKGIAPGQFIVLYNKDKVIGSGEITS